MKKLSPIKLALTFAGCFLGAGYVSGQELWQFFGTFGRGGIWGVTAAVACLFFFALLLLRLGQITGESAVDRLVICWDIPILRRIMSGLELVFLFGISTIMTAGVGALLNQLFGLPAWAGCAVFAAAVMAVAMLGLRGLLSAFSVSVPVLVLATLAFGIAAVCKTGFSALPAETYRGDNPMMPVWTVGALTFANYNAFGAFAILAPFAKYIPDKKTTYLGLGLGAGCLLLIALGVLLSLFAVPETLSAELPMLALAENISPALGCCYGFLLLLAMFGTALSSQVAFLDFVCGKSRRINARKKLAAGVYSAGAFLCSLAGFGGLIGTVYPVFGYCSGIFVLLLVVHYIKVKSQKKERTQFLDTGE